VADDDNLELKKRARRRLVGAAALALLAAIVLPMVMDQEPRPLNQDVQIQIPRQEGDNFAARPIVPRGEAPPAVAANPDTPAEPVSPPAGPSASPAPRAPAPPPAEPARREPPKAEPAKPEVAKPEPPKPESPKPPPSSEASRAEALLSGQSQSYVVQLGAYKDEGNVASLRNRLKTEGFSTYTEKVADKTRVRVGPYPSREAAEKAGNRLRELGLNGVVTVR
jgi:DedD protein